MGIVVVPATIDLTLYQGASWVENFQWTTGVDEDHQSPVDLTAAEVVAQVRESPDSDEIIAQASTADGTIVKDSAGNIEIRVPGAEVGVDSSVTRAYRQVEVHWDDGDICRLVQGKVTISLEVVKDD